MCQGCVKYAVISGFSSVSVVVADGSGNADFRVGRTVSGDAEIAGEVE